jgi:hypothetical protein
VLSISGISSFIGVLESLATHEKFLLNNDRVEIVELKHDEVEEGNHDGEAGDDQRYQDERVLVQDYRGWIVHEDEEIEMDRELGEVLAEECVRTH